MSLRPLPEISAARLPAIAAYEVDEMALDRWNPAYASTQTPENTITVLDRIGVDAWGDGVTAKRVAAALRYMGDVEEIFVDINSPGGDFFEGVAIYNALRTANVKVNVRGLGIAASAASVIAMAGDHVEIAPTAFLMVHNAWAVTVGNRYDLQEAIKTLEPFDDAMASLYAERAGVDKKEAQGWMDKETYFNGNQAVEMGLADALLEQAVIEDSAQAADMAAKNAIRRVDMALAKTGLPRSERRALIGEVKGGKQDATPKPTTQDAGVEIMKGLSALLETIGQKE